MAYKTMTLIVGPDLVDYHIEKLGRALNGLTDVDMEVSLKPLHDAQVAINIKVLKFTKSVSWQDVATTLSQQLTGINVLLADQPAAVYSYSENVVLK